jgi:peptidoglycan-associated lipoprotein
MFTALLAACASDKDALTSKDIPQSGTLKVHPGLLGAPAAPQTPAKADPAVAPAEQPGAR